MSKASKQQYIDVTYNLICQEGLDSVTVRRVTSLLGCTGAALYKRFNNLEYLITLACLRFYEEYMNAIKPFSSLPNTVNADLKAWRRLTEIAFRNADIYFAVLFGRYSTEVGRAISEYMELFPDSYRDLSPFQLRIIARTDLVEREVIALQDSIGGEIPDRPTALRIAKINRAVYHDLLGQAAKTDDPEERKRLGDECYSLIEDVITAHIKNRLRLFNSPTPQS